MNDLVSIIIPVYNGEEYLRRCLDSILNQTYKNLEIIVVNDGSTDSTKKIIDEYKDKRIKPIHKENEGVSEARNDGIEKSTGRYISFVDADDYIEPDFVEKMLNIIKKYKVKYVTCGYKRVYEDHTEYINNDLSESVVSKDDYIKKLLNVQNGYGFVHMKLIEKEVLNKVRFNKELKVGEDALFNIMLCENIDKVVIYNNALYNYYFNSNSVVRKFDDNYSNKYLLSMQCMFDYIKSKYEITTDIYNYIAYHVLLVSVNYCFHPLNKDRGTKLLKNICNIPLYKEAIKKSNYNDLSLTRKISLFTLKHKLYLLMEFICKIRQHQFKNN